ncbi:uncharacterized protein [Miscanthus floridulus]|uniref:uncharacterized protein n=1 Tax=Miscanthus floridulus TaxID=154761 RepID=UPI00345870BD
MLDTHNSFAQQFRMARDRLADNDAEDFVIRIVGPKDGDPPQYSLPTTDQLAMLVVGDFSLDAFERDIIVQKQTGDLHQISALHPAFMALQYPLLFPYVERGWQTGYGGTGKTYLWNRIVGYLRAHNKIVLAIASSGVAALLLPGGHTAHSRFKIPCEEEDDMICDVSRGTMLSELIELTSLVIWDEALMANRKCFEALDCTFRDIEEVKNPQAAHIAFGGKVAVLGGDLRQILPVVEGGTKQDVISATVITSRLWVHVEILSLKQNMRLICSVDDPYQQQEVAAFSKWILNIGEGKIPSIAKDGEDEPSWITVPHELLLPADDDKLAAIVQSVYPNFESRYKNPTYLSQRAILAPTNELTDTVNEYMVPLVPGTEKEYLSLDSITKSTAQHEAYDLLYPIEFLNSISGNNFP